MSSQVKGNCICMLEGENVSYDLRRSARKTLGITVTHKGKLKVTAPKDVPEDKIVHVLQRRSSWICKQMRETSLLPPQLPPKEWVSGETHCYLGRQYRLRIRKSFPYGVRLVGSHFEIGVTKSGNKKEVQKLMERWYLERARSTFERRIQNMIDATPLLHLKEVPPILVRTMKTRWGSCSPAGRIMMNVEAVKVPSGCLDYVLMHELCHLKHPNHSKQFWRHLTRCMPDWARWRRKLDLISV